VNWVAIVIAAIAQFIIGWVWYGPLFGKTWMSMMGMSQQSMSREGMGKTMTLTFIGSLVTAAVLSMLVGWMGAKTLGAGIAAGFWAWLGFVESVHPQQRLPAGFPRRDGCDPSEVELNSALVGALKRWSVET